MKLFKGFLVSPKRLYIQILTEDVRSPNPAHLQVPLTLGSFK